MLGADTDLRVLGLSLRATGILRYFLCISDLPTSDLLIGSLGVFPGGSRVTFRPQDESDATARVKANLLAAASNVLAEHLGIAHDTNGRDEQGFENASLVARVMRHLLTHDTIRLEAC